MNAAKIVKREAYALLCERDIDKITVAEILRRAEVSKQTFYRYFQDKYALGNAIYDDLFTVPVYDAVDAETQRWEDLYLRQFPLYRAHLDFAQHVFSSREQGCATEHEIATITVFDQKWIRARGGDPENPRIAFALEAKDVAGTFAMRQWILGGMETPDGEMVERFRLVLPQVLAPYYT